MGVESVGEGVCAPAHVRGKSTGNDFSLPQCSSLCIVLRLVLR